MFINLQTCAKVASVAGATLQVQDPIADLNLDGGGDRELVRQQLEEYAVYEDSPQAMENMTQEAIEESACCDDEQRPAHDDAAPSDQIECSVPIQASTLETQPKLLDPINAASILLKFIKVFEMNPRLLCLRLKSSLWKRESRSQL